MRRGAMCVAGGQRDREEDIATLQPLTHTQTRKIRNRKIAILIHQLLLQMSSSAAPARIGEVARLRAEGVVTHQPQSGFFQLRVEG